MRWMHASPPRERIFVHQRKEVRGKQQSIRFLIRKRAAGGVTVRPELVEGSGMGHATFSPLRAFPFAKVSSS